MPHEFAVIATFASVLGAFLQCWNGLSYGVAANELSANLRPEMMEEASTFDFNQEQKQRTVPDECSIVMADSSISNSGWGVFTLKTLVRDQTLQESSTGDVVIHLTDPNPMTASGMQRLIWEYLWQGMEVGGQYEGQKVMSLAPGIGMVANGHATMFNVLPQKPTKDAGVDRNSSPGAGAFSHYHNFTWKVQRDLQAGSELFVNYGEGWFKERGYTNQPLPTGRRSVDWLRENGYCMDNLVAGKSELPDAGRGAFASRNLKAGSVVAPVPVLPLASESLKMAKERGATGEIVISEQLMRNYCLGHHNSSLLLFPFSSIVNLINHPSKSEHNVRLEWAEASKSLFDMPVSELQGSSARLLLELVATRPIQEGEEILPDYGSDWVQAWEEHVKAWQPRGDGRPHMSAQRANKATAYDVLSTAAELKNDPYLEDIFTSCYYQPHPERDTNDGGDHALVFQWKDTPGLTEESRNLRPCAVMDRSPGGDGEFTYTVRVFNRPGLPPSQRVPKGRAFILTRVPRCAIEFSDKLYTTDQHLEGAFRKEIGLHIYPRQWLDLSEL